MKEVISVFLTMLLVTVTRICCIIFKKRQRVLLIEWESGGTLYYISRVLSWFLTLYALYCLYCLHSKASYKMVVIILGTMLPSLYFFFLPKNALLEWFDKYQDRRRASRFQLCPHCHQSHIFSRQVMGTEGNYFYLLNKYDHLVLLGDYYNLDHLARSFIASGEEQFSATLSQFYPLLRVSEDDYVIHQGTFFELSDRLHCLKCHSCIDSGGIQRGMIIR